MYDILIYVYENFFASGVYPTNAVLQNRLFAAGFERNEVEEALTWLDDVDHLARAGYTEPLSDSLSVRCLSDAEFDKLGQEGWGFLVFLETSGTVNPMQREWIITSALSVGDTRIGLDRLKLVVLMVLWRQGHPMDALLVEELTGEGEAQLH